MRILLDTNVLVAAFATRGFCYDILQLVLAWHRLLVGETILEELERILVDKLGIPGTHVTEVITRMSWLLSNRRHGPPTTPPIDGSQPPHSAGRLTYW